MAEKIMLKCANCGQIIDSQKTISWKEACPQYLDGKPYETPEFSVKDGVARCPHCGYVSGDLSRNILKKPELLKSAEYSQILRSPAFPDVVNNYIALGYIHEKQGENYHASHAYLVASWLLGDFAKPNDERILLEKACYCSILYINSQKFKESPNLDTLLIAVDILRRIGKFENAKKLADMAIAKTNSVDIKEKLYLEISLCDNFITTPHEISPTAKVFDCTLSDMLKKVANSGSLKVMEKIQLLNDACAFFNGCNVVNLGDGLTLIDHSNAVGNQSQGLFDNLITVMPAVIEACKEGSDEIIADKVEEKKVEQDPVVAMPKTMPVVYSTVEQFKMTQEESVEDNSTINQVEQIAEEQEQEDDMKLEDVLGDVVKMNVINEDDIQDNKDIIDDEMNAQIQTEEQDSAIATFSYNEHFDEPAVEIEEVLEEQAEMVEEVEEIEEVQEDEENFQTEYGEEINENELEELEDIQSIEEVVMLDGIEMDEKQKALDDFVNKYCSEEEKAEEQIESDDDQEDEASNDVEEVQEVDDIEKPCEIEEAENIEEVEEEVEEVEQIIDEVEEIEEDEELNEVEEIELNNELDQFADIDLEATTPIFFGDQPQEVTTKIDLIEEVDEANEDTTPILLDEEQKPTTKELYKQECIRDENMSVILTLAEIGGVITVAEVQSMFDIDYSEAISMLLEHVSKDNLEQDSDEETFRYIRK